MVQKVEQVRTVLWPEVLWLCSDDAFGTSHAPERISLTTPRTRGTNSSKLRNMDSSTSANSDAGVVLETFLKKKIPRRLQLYTDGSYKSRNWEWIFLCHRTICSPLHRSARRCSLRDAADHLWQWAQETRPLARSLQTAACQRLCPVRRLPQQPVHRRQRRGQLRIYETYKRLKGR